ncbi:ABC transporter permease [Catalinimonas sp. 4WD22]|uniref:ABC transporter permease n=1 Tax=Catalinimonas locisalis TaxID=3133978 RepID=UPI003100F901
MKKFKLSLEAEILKAKNSLALWLSLLGTTGIIVAFFFIILFGTENFVPSGEAHPWRHFFLAYYEGTAFMLLPLFAIIIATLVCYVEYSNNMWKHLLISTANRSELYLSKLLLTYLMIITAHFLFIILMLISGVILGLIRPDLKLFNTAPDMIFLFKLAFKTIISIGAMLSIQFWVSIRFRSFIVALGVGVIGFVLSSLLIDGWDYVIFIPYTYPLLYLREVYLEHWLSSVEIYSIIYFLLCTVLGLFDFQKMTMRV